MSPAVLRCYQAALQAHCSCPSSADDGALDRILVKLFSERSEAKKIAMAALQAHVRVKKNVCFKYVPAPVEPWDGSGGGEPTNVSEYASSGVDTEHSERV